MKKSFLIIMFLGLLGATGLSAQSFAGRYIHSEELNEMDIQVDQIVVTEVGTAYEAAWESALATGENEVKVNLLNIVVDTPTRSITFEKNGKSYSGEFINDGEGGYDLVIDGQTLFSKSDW